MAALLVGMSVMAVMLSAALPVWQTAVRREREAELIFRGEQYVQAIALFQRRYAGTFPPSVDVLVKQKFLRRQYRDPITNEDFQVVYVGAGTPTPTAPRVEQGHKGLHRRRLLLDVVLNRRCRSDGAELWGSSVRAGQLNFTNTVLKHMSNPGRMVPIQTLAEAIRSGTRMPDPQGAAGAVKIVQQVFVNGTPRTLEITYREADKTILHFFTNETDPRIPSRHD